MPKQKRKEEWKEERERERGKEGGGEKRGRRKEGREEGERRKESERRRGQHNSFGHNFIVFRPHSSPSYLLSGCHVQGFDVSGIEQSQETQLNPTTAEKHKIIYHFGLFSNRVKISLVVD